MNIIPAVTLQNFDGSKSYDLFSLLLKERIIMLTGEINDDLASIVISEILYLNASSPNEKITIYINSPGGSVSSGLAIYDVMKNITSPIEIMTNRFIYLKKKLNKILAENTSQPLEKINKDTDRNYFMSSEEALKYHLIDEIK